MKHRITRTLFSMVLTFLLVLGMLPAHALRAYADNWVNWEELFAGSGWYDTDEASEDSSSKNQDSQSNNKETSSSQSKNGSQNKNDKQNKNSSAAEEEETEDLPDEIEVEEDGTYTSKEEVAAYLNEFGHLPDNYITKKDAKKLGWVSSEGNLDEVAPGKSIGGDYFGNYEELLPVKKGRSYYECDIDFEGGFRGSKRIIFSDDGLIYYTEDHYQTFELLYGEE